MKFVLLAVVAVAGSASAGVGSIDSVNITTRVWNDFPTSSITTTNNFPSSVNIHEDFAAGTVGNYANRHVGVLASGGTNYSFTNAESFRLDVDVRISAPNGQPRKETGLIIGNYIPGGNYFAEGNLMVASDGEVAMFGGALPFHSFGNVYTVGSWIHLSFMYINPALNGGTAAAVFGVGNQSFSGNFDPGWSNGLGDGSFVEFYAQNQRNPYINDSADSTWANFSITDIPAPGSAGLIGIAGLLSARRRR